MALTWNNEYLRTMAEKVGAEPDGHRHVNNDYLKIIAEKIGSGDGTVDATKIQGIIPAENLPSYVDDVVEYASLAALPATGETGKIYVTTDTNTTYRWSGSTYVPISNMLDYATQAEAETGTNNEHIMTPLRTRQAFASHVDDATAHVTQAERDGWDDKVGISTDPTDAGPIVELTAKGWAEQDTTTGKNLLPPRSSSVTANGITFTVNADGSITCTGTASSRAIIQLPITGLQTNTAYTLSGCPANGSDSSYRADLRNNADGIAGVADYGAGATFTLSTTYPNLNYSIRIESGYACPSGGIVFKPQIELGSTATSYEPYSGAKPSPSPSYPQEVRRCRGRNLLHTSPDLPQTINGITISNAGNGHVKVNGTATANTSRGFAMFDAKAGETYYVTVPTITGNHTFFLWDDVGSKMVASSKKAPFTFTSPATQEYLLAISMPSGTVLNNFDIAAQVEEGTTGHPFVPYGHVGVDVTHDGTTTTIPIPLPSRGWVAALPDGTSDTLVLDGAGGYVWELNVKELVFDGVNVKMTGGASNSAGAIRYYHYLADTCMMPSSGNTISPIYVSHFLRQSANYTWGNSDSSVAINTSSGSLSQLVFLHDSLETQSTAAFNTWLQSNPVTVLYPLATPTTERGYVDYDNELPAHCSISCIELESLSVRCLNTTEIIEIHDSWTKRNGIDTSSIATATANANTAAQSANTAATAANNAASSANDAAERAEDAIDAIGDISEQAVPLMSESTRGGAKLGHGLVVEDGALGIGEVTDPTDAGPIVALSANGWAEQTSTTGKNLFYLTPRVANGITLTVASDGAFVFNGTSTAATTFEAALAEATSGATTLSIKADAMVTEDGVARLRTRDADRNLNYNVALNVDRDWYSVSNSSPNAMVSISVPEGVTLSNYKVYVQLELGSTATSYEPYSGGAPSPSPSYPQEIRRVTGHTISGKTGRFVDILVTHDGTTTTIPIPLPSRGWVGALPDGTADTLTLDGAGGYEWTLATNEKTLNGSETGWTKSTATAVDILYCNANNSVNAFDVISTRHLLDVLASHFVGATTQSAANHIEFDNGFINMSFESGTFADAAAFKTWLQSNPITVLYPLATPTTERGYVDSMPTVPAHSVLSCPDLTDLAVRCCADEGAAEIASAWGKRITALEQTVAAIVAQM